MSHEIMRYATIDLDGYLYVHTIEDYSDDDIVCGYVFSYPIMHVSHAGNDAHRRELVDTFVTGDTSEDVTFTTEESFNRYIDAVGEQHVNNRLYIIGKDISTVGELVYTLLIRSLDSSPPAKIDKQAYYRRVVRIEHPKPDEMYTTVQLETLTQEPDEHIRLTIDEVGYILQGDSQFEMQSNIGVLYTPHIIKGTLAGVYGYR